MISVPLLIATLVYAGIGLLIFVLGFIIWDKLTPIDLWHEIAEKHNNALAILAGSIAIALGLIISAAIHG
jgi:putative membrane protein